MPQQIRSVLTRLGIGEGDENLCQTNGHPRVPNCMEGLGFGTPIPVHFPHFLCFPPPPTSRLRRFRFSSSYSLFSSSSFWWLLFLFCSHLHSLYCRECLVWSIALDLCGGRLSAHVVCGGRAQEEEEDCVRDEKEECVHGGR